MLTPSLEDYLETIYEQVRDQKVARVRDIAKARGVQAGSVSPAMRRLADMGYIRYIQREYIDLTPAGESEALRVLTKHRLLSKFFEDILKMPKRIAESDACAVEHSISSEGIAHLLRFVEFIQICPDGQSFLESFHNCNRVQLEDGTSGNTASKPFGKDCKCSRFSSKNKNEV